jgi:hypothetical protein
MRRHARRLFAFCAAVSLALCVAAVALWVRSHGVQDEWGATNDSVRRGLTSSAGRLTFLHVTMENSPVPLRRAPLSWRRSAPDGGGPERVPGQWAYDAFRFSLGGRHRFTFGAEGSVRLTVREFSTHYWLPAALAAVMPATWLRRTLKQRRGTSVNADVSPPRSRGASSDVSPP